MGLREQEMSLNDKLVSILLNQFNFSQSDLDKVRAILDNINVKTVNGQTFIEIRLNKISIILESDEHNA